MLSLALLRRFSVLLCLCCGLTAFAQTTVPVQSYTVGEDGRALLEVASDSDHYYLLQVRHDPSEDADLITAIQRGAPGSTVLTESPAAYPAAHYEVLRYPVALPADTDGDGTDDLTELGQLPVHAPLNAAPPIPTEDGLAAVDSFTTFKRLSIARDVVDLSEFLNGKSFVKFIIDDFHTTQPKIYFINSNAHDLHADFAAAVGIDYLGDQVKKGQVIFHPTSISNNGTLGTFAFNYSNGHGDDFEVVQRSFELLARNMPFLENNLSYFVTERSEDEYARDADLYAASRVPVLFEADVYADVDYWGLHQTEGYGIFRQISLEELPGPRDIVLYESLPNDLPRVAGIMTSVVQTPLSHVNLRAIQNNVPNAFIRDPLAVDSIAALLDRPIYFRVEQDRYVIREATPIELNAWFEDLRPDEPQLPPLNLDYTEIRPLSDIEFGMFDGYGAKCANVAVMRTFGFPAGTIPDGYGVPFYFYQEFMQHNGFFDEVRAMIADNDFMTDRDVREVRLKVFRRKIKDADMPDWMLDALADMHAQFPAGTSVRCRSSTNNEDLPGFNGAGLYTSKTQHPHEGHIKKSIKQVYASLWNLRAYEEREFYRIDHYTASMGVLCHPNYTDEKANGVGVSLDPLYNTEHTFYLNTQVGEELITNPNGESVPEEILLDRTGGNANDFVLVQRSNLVDPEGRIMTALYLDEMRDYLNVIHDEFAVLYRAVGDPTFAMDIEYKITADDQLIIKQARPWVSFVPRSLPEQPASAEQLAVFPNPATTTASVLLPELRAHTLLLTDMLGRPLLRMTVAAGITVADLSLAALPPGIYVVVALDAADEFMASGRLIKQ